MPRVTIYCMQPYWRDGDRKLAHGIVREFSSEKAAVSAGRRAAQREAGALVYKVVGDPDFEDWSQPTAVAAFGDVPEITFNGKIASAPAEPAPKLYAT